MSQLSKEGLVLGQGLGINNIGEFTVQTAAFLQVFVIKFYAPFFNGGLYGFSGNCVHVLSVSQQIVKLLPGVFRRLRAEHLGEKTTLF